MTSSVHKQSFLQVSRLQETVRCHLARKAGSSQSQAIDNFGEQFCEEEGIYVTMKHKPCHVGLDPGTLKYTSAKFLLKVKEVLRLSQLACDELVAALDQIFEARVNDVRTIWTVFVDCLSFAYSIRYISSYMLES